jgi:hypothetical protein
LLPGGRIGQIAVDGARLDSVLGGYLGAIGAPAHGRDAIGDQEFADLGASLAFEQLENGLTEAPEAREHDGVPFGARGELGAQVLGEQMLRRDAVRIEDLEPTFGSFLFHLYRGALHRDVGHV